MGSMTAWRRRMRLRHPCDRGSHSARQLGAAFRFLLESHTWKRHPEPFNKTKRGRERRDEKRFVNASKRIFT